MDMNTNYDVIVTGGGPAGSTVASILAREGRKVVLFEKERFPRHHIGESLMTDTYFTFERMGLLEKLKQSPFVVKYSVQFANPAGRESRPFYFFEANHHESAVTWQVTRAVFDQLLIEHAADQGATVYQKTPVKRVIFEAGRACGVEAQMQDGSLQQFNAQVVVDATVVLRTPPGSGGWFWYIPLENDITSVGIVADPDYLMKDRGKDLAKIFNEEIEKCESCRKRVAGAERVDKIYSIVDYSYRSKPCAGDGFILIGDAYG